MSSFDEIRLEEGQILFKAGEPADKLYFIQSGSIQMADKNTGAVFATMASIASVSKRDFTNMGKFLTVGLVVVLLAMVANIFLQMPVLHLVISAAVVLLFSGYILYDISQIMQGGETNYVSATLAVYLDWPALRDQLFTNGKPALNRAEGR